jgi:hypothetical protein
VESQPQNPDQTEKLNLRDAVGGLYTASWAIGIIGLLAAVLLGFFEKDQFHRFFYSYMVGFLFFLAIALGGLFFVMLQHATKAAWSVSVRRIAEWFASSLPLMAVLSVPILASVVVGQGKLYPWATDDWAKLHESTFKGLWLGRGFFLARAVLYLAIWSGLGVWFWRQSVKQDQTGDIELTKKMQHAAPVGLILFGLSLTFFAWDWIMSLDPTWYSTIFGVYFFAGCALAVFSSLVIVVRLLQGKGFLVNSVNIEHFHDLGKYLFGFTFFWGYIAFSQFMLQWYGNIPDEVGWFQKHGASTQLPNAYSPVVITLLIAHFVIPFPGLLSRHVKRNGASITFWAVWVLAGCWLDIYWLVMPLFDDQNVTFGLIDIAVFLGIGGVFVAFVIHRASQYAVRPLKDPRLSDALAFQNF